MKNQSFIIGIIILQAFLLILYAAFLDPVRSNNVSYFLQFFLTIIATLGFLSINHSKKQNFGDLIKQWLIILIISIEITSLLQKFWYMAYIRNISNPLYSSDLILSGCQGAIMVTIIYSTLKNCVRMIHIFTFTIISIIGYTCNQMILIYKMGVYDVGNGMIIYLFGTICGFTIKLVGVPRVQSDENKQVVPISKNKSLLGILFSIIFFPFFFNGNQFSEAIMIISILSSIVISILCQLIQQKRISINLLFECSISSSIIMLSSANLIQNLGQPLIIGGFIGLTYTLWSKYLKLFLQKIKISDPTLNFKLFGFPAFLGGIIAAINIASYLSPNTDKLHTFFYVYISAHPIKYGAIEIGGVFVTVAMSIATGIFTGLLIRFTYGQKEFNDQEWNGEQQEIRNNFEDQKNNLLLHQQTKRQFINDKFENEKKKQHPYENQKDIPNENNQNKKQDEFKYQPLKI